MAIDALYKDYFQRSKVFLYPLLGIKRGSVAAPRQCYISWHPAITTEDVKLICVYSKRTDLEYKNFERTVLLQHKRLTDYIELIDDDIMLTFDFSDIKDDWNNFVNGKYSKIDSALKRKILNHFDKQSSTYVYMESYLFPDKYFNLYADLLNTDVSLLREVGELCSPPNLEKENLIAEVIDLQNKKILG